MAYHYGAMNNTKYQYYAGGLWNIIQTLVSASWCISGSGDGVSNVNLSGSCFTNPTQAGAGGLQNTGSWARLAALDGRELVFYNGSTAGYVTIGLSQSGTFKTGGTVNGPPTASDQVFIYGTSFTPAGASPWLSNSTQGNSYVDVVANDSYPYDVYVFSFNAGNGADNLVLIMDALSSGSLSSGSSGLDPDVHMYWAGATGQWTSTSPSTTLKGLIAGSLINHNFALPGQVGSTSVGNPYTNTHDVVFPLVYSSTTPSQAFIRGYLMSLLYDLHATTVVNHSIVDYGSPGAANKLLVGYYLIPWSGSIVTV